MANPTVQQLYEGMKERLKLHLLNPTVSLIRKIRSPEIHRPGLALSGFYDLIRSSRKSAQLIRPVYHHLTLLVE